MELPSVTVFDYWSPSSAVQRLLSGAAVDQMQVQVNGDFHEIWFSGVARDLVDNSGSLSGLDLLTAFPEEPALDAFDYSIVPGNLGQAWLGTAASQFFTITTASLVGALKEKFTLSVAGTGYTETPLKLLCSSTPTHV